MSRYYRPRKLYVRRALRRAAKFRQFADAVWRTPIQYHPPKYKSVVQFLLDGIMEASK